MCQSPFALIMEAYLHGISTARSMTWSRPVQNDNHERVVVSFRLFSTSHSTADS
jgi:hypothetical protein